MAKSARIVSRQNGEGNRLAQANRGPKAMEIVGLGFPICPTHYPTHTGEHPVCSCGDPHTKDPKRIGKHPMVHLVPHGFKDASSDPEVVRSWWEAEPQANIGLVTGWPLPWSTDRLPRYLFVTDNDPGGDDQFRAAGIALPQTFQVHTGRGRHVYFWTPEPMSCGEYLLHAAGITNVNVRGLGGYVLAPGSLHYSGEVYSAVGPLSGIADVVAVPEALTPFLIPHSAKARSRKQRTTPRRTENITPIGAGLPKLDGDAIPADVLTLLEADPELGKRSEPAFKAIQALLDITDDDEVIAGTILAHPIGARYHEKSLSGLYAEIQRAREWKAIPARQRSTTYRERQKIKVDQQWAAAQKCLPVGTLKVLRGFQLISIRAGGGRFAASLEQVAIESSVARSTALKHRNRLLDSGWLRCVYRASPNTGFANRYEIAIPAGGRAPSDKRTKGAHVPQGVGCVRLLTARSAETLGEGGTPVRYIRRRARGCAEGAFLGPKPPAPESAPRRADGKAERKSAPKIALDLSSDCYRYNTTHHLWVVLPYLTGRGTTQRKLAAELGKTDRQVRRYVKQLWDLKLIPDRNHLRLVPDWRQRLERLSVERGTAGMREAARLSLDMRRRQQRRAELVRKGTGEWTEDGHVAVSSTGEIV
jgi:hypothetical protein